MNTDRAPAGPNVLEMVDVTVGDLADPNRIVLEHVNWSVAAGDYWVIGGLHSSGKSNLMATLAGILPIMAGEYRVFGEDVSAPSQLERLTGKHRLGIVFDGGRLIHDLTITDNVALPLRYHENATIEEAMPRAYELVELVGIEPFAALYPAAIGRNWQQRAGLARALALKPEVLLLDNPLTGLDPRDALWWLDFMDKLWAGKAMPDQKPTTLIATADDLGPWRERAKKFALLKDRNFVVLGEQQELLRHTEPLLRDLLPELAPRT